MEDSKKKGQSPENGTIEVPDNATLTNQRQYECISLRSINTGEKSIQTPQVAWAGYKAKTLKYAHEPFNVMAKTKMKLEKLKHPLMIRTDNR